MAIQLMSNVKIITSGVIPTVANLLPGQAAFGKLTADGKYHLFGNTGEGGGSGKVVDIVLDTYAALDAATLQSVLTSGNKSTLDIQFTETADGEALVTIGKAGLTAGTTTVTKDGFTDNGKIVLSANPALVVSEADAATMRGFLSVYSKAEIDAKVASVMHIKGSVEAFANLPESPAVGDVYNIKTAGGTDIHGDAVKAGDNVVYVAANGDDPAGWDILSGVVDLTSYYTKDQVDAELAKKADAATTYNKTEVDAAVKVAKDAADAAQAGVDAINAKGYQTAADVTKTLTDGHYVADADYVHTDNNYDATAVANVAKAAKLVIDGDGTKVLKNDGSYDTISITVAEI